MSHPPSDPTPAPAEAGDAPAPPESLSRTTKTPLSPPSSPPTSPPPVGVAIQDLQRSIGDKLDALTTAVETLTRVVNRIEESRQPDPTTPKSPQREASADSRSRLHKMSKASARSEEDLEIERRKSMAVAATSSATASRSARLQQMSLAQRKREFVQKTAPGTAGGKRGGDKTGKIDRTMASARKALERERAHRAQADELEREQANSLGSWITVVLLAILGTAAVVLGGVAYARSKEAALALRAAEQEL